MSESAPLSANVPPGAIAPGGAPASDQHARVARPSRRLEIVASLAVLAVSGSLFMLASGITVRTETGGVDPRWWPLVLAGTALALSALLLVVALIRPPFDRDDLEVTGPDGWVRLGLAVVASALYLVAWDLIGFVLPTLLFLALLVWVFGRRHWKGLVIFPIAMTAFIYGLFDVVLKVPL